MGVAHRLRVINEFPATIDVLLSLIDALSASIDALLSLIDALPSFIDGDTIAILYRPRCKRRRRAR